MPYKKSSDLQTFNNGLLQKVELLNKEIADLQNELSVIEINLNKEKGVLAETTHDISDTKRIITLMETQFAEFSGQVSNDFKFNFKYNRQALSELLNRFASELKSENNQASSKKLTKDSINTLFKHTILGIEQPSQIHLNALFSILNINSGTKTSQGRELRDEWIQIIKSAYSTTEFYPSIDILPSNANSAYRLELHNSLLLKVVNTIVVFENMETIENSINYFKNKVVTMESKKSEIEKLEARYNKLNEELTLKSKELMDITEPLKLNTLIANTANLVEDQPKEPTSNQNDVHLLNAEDKKITKILKKIEEQIVPKEYYQELMTLKQLIDNLDEYVPSENKEIISELETNWKNYILKHQTGAEFGIPFPEDREGFKVAMETTLKELPKSSSVQKIVANILLCLLTVTILPLVIRLTYTKSTHGNMHYFFKSDAELDILKASKSADKLTKMELKSKPEEKASDNEIELSAGFKSPKG